jgi:hypothetical protein
MLGSHIYYTNSFSAWQISGNDLINVCICVATEAAAAF